MVLKIKNLFAFTCYLKIDIYIKLDMFNLKCFPIFKIAIYKSEDKLWIHHNINIPHCPVFIFWKFRGPKCTQWNVITAAFSYH